MKIEKILKILNKELGIETFERGKNIFFICPFHDDKNPSLSLKKDEGYFKCFSCGFAARNIFIFYSKYKNITLKDTFYDLQEKGYIEKDKINFKREEKKKKEDELLETFKIITNVYQNNLLSEEGTSSYDYLKKERMLTNKIIETFMIGSTISNNQLNNLFSENYNLLNCFNKLNLIQINKNGKSFDFFKEKQIIFPIKNAKGEIVTIASRKIEKDVENKYLFLPNNELIKKSSVIYNYDYLKNNINIFFYLVEGFFDVISMSKIGIKNCISLLGTTISNEQIEILKFSKKKIVLFLDGDKAGIEATIKISILLTLNEIECEIVKNESNMDPDEICRSEKDIIFEIIKKRENPFVFVINYYFKELEIIENPQKINNFISKISKIFFQFGKNIHFFIINKISILINLSFSEIEKIYFKNDL